MEGVKRIRILDVPVDVLEDEAFEQVVLRQSADGRLHHLVFIGGWDLVRGWADKEFRAVLEAASLILPTSKSVLRHARFLRRDIPRRYMPFDLLIRALGLLERKGRSVYLLGGDKKSLQKVDGNLRRTFPGLKLVGRFNGNFPKELEGGILTAIQKATPAFIFVGRGVRGGNRWLFRRRTALPPSICVWEPDSFDVMAGRRKKTSRDAFNKGIEYLPGLALRPWRLVRVFGYFVFGVALIWARLRGR